MGRTMARSLVLCRFQWSALDWEPSDMYSGTPIAEDLRLRKYYRFLMPQCPLYEASLVNDWTGRELHLNTFRVRPLINQIYPLLLP